MEAAKTFDGSMDAALAAMGSGEEYSHVKICTMTVTIMLDEVDDICLEKMKDAMMREDVIEFIHGVLGTELILKQGGGGRSFNNCLIFTFKDDETDSNKTIKVFSNGRLHVTGAKNLSEAVTFGEFFLTLLNQMFGCEGGVGDVIVNMINTTFHYFYHVDLDKVHRLLSGKGAVYDQDRHPGVINKLRGIGTVIFFRTGAIIMTGIKTGDQALKAHLFVTSFMLEHGHAIRVDDCDVHPPKKKSRLLGHSSVDYGSFLLLS